MTSPCYGATATRSRYARRSRGMTNPFPASRAQKSRQPRRSRLAGLKHPLSCSIGTHSRYLSRMKRFDVIAEPGDLLHTTADAFVPPTRQANACDPVASMAPPHAHLTPHTKNKPHTTSDSRPTPHAYKPGAIRLRIYISRNTAMRTTPSGATQTQWHRLPDHRRQSEDSSARFTVSALNCSPAAARRNGG